MENLRNIIIDTLDDVGIYFSNSNEDDVDLREYIIDSIQFISFIVALEEKMGCEYPDELLLIDNISSLNSFSNLLAEIISSKNL